MDAIVVGGGPAGSTCAWRLKQAGLEVLVLDRAAFPRLKLCAGWVTPQALADLELRESDYPGSFLTFEQLHLHWKAFTVKPRSRQHSIRRIEFDDFLLRRAGAEVRQHRVSTIERDGKDYLLDGEYRCRYLVGAGGTSCPVYKNLFHEESPRSAGLQTATYEQEFAYDWRDPACHLWFFDGGLPGYAWYVPKGEGFVNIGLGGMASRLKEQGGHIREHWQAFVNKLKREGLVRYDDYHPTGYSYFLRGRSGVARVGNAYIVGDAVGLATRDMCEGIGPAVRSGLLAARSIVSRTAYSIQEIDKLSGHGLASRVLERQFAGTA